MQLGLAERGMQARLAGIVRQRLLVLSRGLVPAAALEQQVTEKTVSPRRIAVQVRSPVGQPRREIQILVTKPEPGFARVRIDRGELAELLGGGPKILLAQVAGRQCLARFPVRRVQLERALKVGNRLLRRSRASGSPVWRSRSAPPGSVAGPAPSPRGAPPVVFGKTVVGEANVDLGLKEAGIEGQNFPELFRGAGKLAVPEGLLAQAKVAGNPPRRSVSSKTMLTAATDSPPARVPHRKGM